MHHFNYRYFPLWKKNHFYDISPFTSFFLKMVSCYFKILKWMVLSILILSSSSSILLLYYFPSSDDNKDASLFESPYSYWLPSFSWSINSSKPLCMISSIRPLCKQSGNFLDPFSMVTLKLQAFGGFMDEGGFCKSIFALRTYWMRTTVLIVIWLYQWFACWIGLRYVSLQNTSPDWNMSVSSCNSCRGIYHFTI